MMTKTQALLQLEGAKKEYREYVDRQRKAVQGFEHLVLSHIAKLRASAPPEFRMVLNDFLWEVDCYRFRGKVLTGEKAHYCFEWDELPVDETCDEWPCKCWAEI